MSTPGIVHNPDLRWISTETRLRRVFHNGTKNGLPQSSRLKSAAGRRMVLAATCRATPLPKTGRRGGRLSPPVFLVRKAARKRCCFELVLRLTPKEQLDRSQFKRT